MRVLQINAVANTGSTGRIAEEIGNVLMEHGHESYIAYGRGHAKSTSRLLKIGSTKDVYLHGIYTLLTDRHGFSSKGATERLIRQIQSIKPDILALHNLHGYYIHLPTLFDFIRTEQIPVLWTLFDCWAFTGHCSYFDDINCDKWKTHCHSCPKHRQYPGSWVDNSRQNFENKRSFFTSLKQLELVTHSYWLQALVKESFLQAVPVNVMPSAVNLDVFKPTSSELRNKYQLGSKKIILGCASVWSQRKGLSDFVQLSRLLNAEYQIVLIGLSAKEIMKLPNSILGIQRTESIVELAQWYSLAYAFVNPTTQDNFPTTNLEALACGTPVITYNTGGSPEAIDEYTGFVVEKGDVPDIVKKIDLLGELNYAETSMRCRARAELLYDRKTRFLDYLVIFERMLATTKEPV